ncbi:MAG TPA: FxsA family protein [Gammaproteobacteria bacterium]
MLRWLFAAFLIVPLIEIYLLLAVGSYLGVLPTVALIIFTAVLGVVLIRIQGLLTLFRIQEKVRRGEPPAGELLTGAALLLAGALLLTPGFFTDTLGFLLLVPAVRRRLFARIVSRLFRPPGSGRGPGGGGAVLEGHFTRDD